MKQVTGSNLTISENKVSIQLPLGGHSFSIDSIPEKILSGTELVEFCLLTPRTTLIPRESFDERALASYLNIVGLPCGESESPVVSDTLAQVIAVMAIDTAALQTITETFGSRARFTSPLLEIQKFTSPAVWLYRTDNLLYIKVYNTTLRFAEVVQAECDADIIQLINDVDSLFSLDNYAIHCSGKNGFALRKLLTKYYSDVRCE